MSEDVIKGELLSSKKMADLGCGWKSRFNPFKSIRARIEEAAYYNRPLKMQALWTAKKEGYEDNSFQLSTMAVLINLLSFMTIVVFHNFLGVSNEVGNTIANSTLLFTLTVLLPSLLTVTMRKRKLTRIALPPPMTLPRTTTGWQELDEMLEQGPFVVGFDLIEGGMTADEVKDIGQLATEMAFLPQATYGSKNGLLETEVHQNVTPAGIALVEKAMNILYPNRQQQQQGVLAAPTPEHEATLSMTLEHMGIPVSR